MGFFSWKAADTDQSISNIYSERGALAIYLVTPDDEFIFEPAYEGYGVFGGKDAYMLLTQWNVPEQCTGDVEHDRHIGIMLGDDVKYPLKFAVSKIPYNHLSASAECEYQGYFYDDKEEGTETNDKDYE